MTGQGRPDAEPPQPVPSGLSRSYTTAEQQAPLDAYTAMVAGHDAGTAQKLYTDDYLQHGPFGPNVTRSEFEAGNRDIVWKAMPDIVRLRGGRVCEHWLQVDLLGLLNQLQS